jgi:hypothetical protein
MLSEELNKLSRNIAELSGDIGTLSEELTTLPGISCDARGIYQVKGGGKACSCGIWSPQRGKGRGVGVGLAPALPLVTATVGRTPEGCVTGAWVTATVSKTPVTGALWGHGLPRPSAKHPKGAEMSYFADMKGLRTISADTTAIPADTTPTTAI